MDFARLNQPLPYEKIEICRGDPCFTLIPPKAGSGRIPRETEQAASKNSHPKPRETPFLKKSPLVLTKGQQEEKEFPSHTSTV